MARRYQLDRGTNGLTEVKREGSGEKVLLLHGWGGSCESFAPVVSALSKMGYEAFAPSFPGFGQTPEPPEPWGVEEYAEWTLGFIRENGLEGCPVVAHSFGGRVAILLASRHKQLFSKMILVDAAGVLPKRSFKYHLKTYAYKFAKLLYKNNALRGLLKLEARIKSAGSADYRALSNPMKKTFVKVVNLDLTPCLSKINRPTLLIWGGEDKETPLYMAKIMERLIPDAGLVVFEGAGHFSYLDEFGRFCAVIRSFLEAKV